MRHRRRGAEWKFSMTAKTKQPCHCASSPTTATPSCFPVAPLPGSFCYLGCHSITSHWLEGAFRFSLAPQHPSGTPTKWTLSKGRAHHSLPVNGAAFPNPYHKVTCHPLLSPSRHPSTEHLAVICLFCCLSIHVVIFTPSPCCCDVVIS